MKTYTLNYTQRGERCTTTVLAADASTAVEAYERSHPGAKVTCAAFTPDAPRPKQQVVVQGGELAIGEAA